MRLLSVLLALGLAGGLAAHPAPRPVAVNDTLQSVRVLGDSTVQFAIYAPEAEAVSVFGDFPNPVPYQSQAMARDADGVWRTTITGIPPDAYLYEFTVDGVRTFDPKNVRYKEAESVFSNLFVMPGEATEYIAVRDVPHGMVSQVWFNSDVTGAVTRFHVYTPPGYESMDGPLPVLYLQHGGGENDASWTTAGMANVILDNLLADGQVVPMIVVMPMGRPASGFGMAPGVDDDPYYRQLFEEIIPEVETRFNVSHEPADRAFAGLSMGGIQALNIALFRPEMFGAVLPLSTGYFPPMLAALEDEHADALANPAINDLDLFWIAMGGETDIAYQNGLNTLALLDRHGIHYETADYPAGHTFVTWRRNLAEFAPLLFQ